MSHIIWRRNFNYYHFLWLKYRHLIQENLFIDVKQTVDVLVTSRSLVLGSTKVAPCRVLLLNGWIAKDIYGEWVLNISRLPCLILAVLFIHFAYDDIANTF